MKFFALILLLCACPVVARAQTAPVIERAGKLVEDAKFEEAQKLLEAELAKTTDKIEREALQNALADVHVRWTRPLHLANDSQGMVAHYLRAYETDKELRRPYAALDLLNIGLAYVDLKRYDESLNYLKLALPLFREFKAPQQEAITLNNIAYDTIALKRYEESLSYSNLALTIVRQWRDQGGESFALENLGSAYKGLNDPDQALRYYEMSLKIATEINAKPRQAFLYNNIGAIHLELADYQKALEFFAQALAEFRAVPDVYGEATTLNNIGGTYEALSNYEEAINHYESALAIHQKFNGLAGQATALSNIGTAYRKMSRYSEALRYYQRTLAIDRETKDDAGEATTLNNIGVVYQELNRKEIALDYYQKALQTQINSQDRAGQATTLNNIAIIYSRQGRYGEALKTYNATLIIYRQLQHRYLEAQTLSSMGTTYNRSNRASEALPYWEQALVIQREINDRDGQAGTLDQIGQYYHHLKNYPEALQNYMTALAIERDIHDRAGETNTLNSLMFLYLEENQWNLAILCGKLAINCDLAIRGDIQTLDKESQRSYLSEHRATYETLAALLIGQNRLEEAEQILRLLRLEDAYEFAHRDPQLAQGLAALLQPLSFSPTEKPLLRPNDEVAVGEGALESQLWQQALQERERAGGGRVALISTFNTDDGFFALLCTSKGRQAFSISIKKTEFDALSQRLARELSQPRLDPRLDAEKMYRIVFCNGKLEKALADENIEVALWFASGSLRSIPIDALHDRNNYLVANARANVNVTLTSRQLFEAQSKGAMLAAGTSLPHTVDAPIAGDAPLQFSALSNVPREVRAIVSDDKHGGIGPFAGTILLDKDFSAANLSQSLSGDVAALHIATHFALNNGGDVNSFLLLGDGKTLPISAWKESLKLRGVGLLALSACETGVGRDGATGAEVSSIGEISQWLGAQSVLVSLWPVADDSTATLMGDFYRRWHDNPNEGKIAALRAAQRQLLGTQTAATADGKRGKPIRELEDGETPDFVRDPNHPFAHPFYWAPFTLVGNWR